MNNKTREWGGIIKAVNTPIAFLVLGVLFLNAVMGVVALVQAEYRGVLVFTLVASVLSLMAIVVALGVFRPEALQGVRPWHEAYPPRLADDLYMAVEGAFDNLNQVEREEAWATLADVLKTARKDDKDYKKFCASVAERIALRVATKKRLQKSRQSPRKGAVKA
ncbi:hypothetical protein [Paraburkholderia caffeinilytica]|uniref:Uncharacterized protein n=1 Tax=Paraburkholderia caffeinilytica TaxID=1761016 RepID=A0ABQ1M8U4_9BURK|nr:hypothetical protein [Paraburkholderia caffeinilytica]GGC35667.1 hypothetical protein GCM10011400_22880 [Paraburkholderia caffeinilytica]CAB3794393.1 hypothetical protein LMG28690_03923 [Paraburkholderia caffeinilytica]